MKKITILLIVLALSGCANSSHERLLRGGAVGLGAAAIITATGGTPLLAAGGGLVAGGFASTWGIQQDPPR